MINAKHRRLAWLAGVLAVVPISATAIATTPSTDQGSADWRVCFPAANWDADDDKRPCVEVKGIYEDGSFSYTVTNADGVKRYTAGIGALDQ